MKSLGFSIAQSEYTYLEEKVFLNLMFHYQGQWSVNGGCMNVTLNDNKIKANTLSCICCEYSKTIIFIFSMYVI